VTASKKLKKLEARLLPAGLAGLVETVDSYEAKQELACVLPLIVAVVEAAEIAKAATWQPHGKSYWEIEQLLNEIRDSADAALAALDEALT
jgi:hypothetical protein